MAVIWLGETVNAFGSALTFWALAWLLYRTYPAQPLVAAAVLSVLSVSGLLGTLALGAWLDVWDRRRTLMVCNLALALLTALVPVVTRAAWGLLPLLALVSLIALSPSCQGLS